MFQSGDLVKFNNRWFAWSSHPSKEKLKHSIIELIELMPSSKTWKTFFHTSMAAAWHQEYMNCDESFLEKL